MKISYLLLASLCLAAPLSAQQAEKKNEAKAEKTVEAKTPSLTFYYFDG